MGSLIDLEIPNGYSKASLYEILREEKIPTTLVNSKSFRSVFNSSDPLSFLHSLFLGHLKIIRDSKRSFLVLDKFDLWPSLPCDKEGEKVNKLGRRTGLKNSYTDSIKHSEGVDSRVDKWEVSWTYKFLYWIRFSVVYVLREQFDHTLTCLCIYGDPFNSRGFYEDVFTHRYQLDKFLSLEFSRDLKPNLRQLSSLKNLSQALNSFGDNSVFDCFRESPYDHIDGNTRVLNLNIPFEVDCQALELSSVNLICGPESSGKTTLLKAISKAWSLQTAREDQPDTLGTTCYVFNLEYHRLASQFVGCAESYVKEVFVKANFNKPALVVLDGIELLCERAENEEERAVPLTVTNTLLNQLYNLDPGVKFLSSTSGNFKVSRLSKSFLNMVTTLIVLSKKSTDT